MITVLNFLIVALLIGIVYQYGKLRGYDKGFEDGKQSMIEQQQRRAGRK